MRVFLLRDLLPRDIVASLAYVLWFVPLWRRDVKLRQTATMQDNFLTQETTQDMLGPAQSIIVAIKMFRMRHPHVLFDPSR